MLIWMASQSAVLLIFQQNFICHGVKVKKHVTRHHHSRTIANKCLIWGICVCAGGLDYVKIYTNNLR